MKLNTLTIINFKGIKHQEFNFAGKSATIFGRNGSGKTTVYDAFLFLLFGKDSRGSATFSIKPIVDGEQLHNVETHVEAELDTGDGTISLIRKYREVWSRKRGDVSETFTGHESTYYVDGLPVSQAMYKAKVDALVNETTFRSLTNPFYFPEVMRWQDRRSQLFKLFGSLTDQDVAAQDPRFQQLLKDCGHYTVEQFRDGMKVNIRKYNQDLKEIPARMDEVARQIIEDDDTSYAEASLEAIADEIRRLKASLEEDGDAELTAQRVAVEGEIAALQQKNQAHRDRIRVQNAENNRKAMNDLAEQIAGLDLVGHEAAARMRVQKTGEIQKRIEDLRAKFTAVASEPYEPIESCPTCGRPFDKSNIEEARQAWETAQKDRLDSINTEGRELAKMLKAAKEEASEALSELEKRQKIAAEYEAAMDALRTVELAPDMDGYAEQMNQLTEKRSAILEAIAAASEGVKAKTANIMTQIAQKQNEYAEAKKTLAELSASRSARERLDELRSAQQETVEALEDAEATVALCEEFIRTRVSMVEDSVNSHFKLVKWQLYRDQINGGLEEICEATVDGIPYHDLNGAMRINAGLDIINACIDATGISAPAFVDNAESVTNLYNVNAQVIRLVVSAKDTQLRLQK